MSVGPQERKIYTKATSISTVVPDQENDSQLLKLYKKKKNVL
jgi:hypothetical protein